MLKATEAVIDVEKIQKFECSIVNRTAGEKFCFQCAVFSTLIFGRLLMYSFK